MTTPTLTRVSTTSTRAARDALNDLTIVHGVGNLDKGEACTVAAINLGLTGKLTDGPHPCMSDVIRRWVIKVQDAAPLDIIRSERWRAAAMGLVNSSAPEDVEQARSGLCLSWMWDRLADPAVVEAVPEEAQEAWAGMLETRTEEAAGKAARNAADVAYCVAYYAARNAERAAAAERAASAAAASAYYAFAAENATAAAYYAFAAENAAHVAYVAHDRAAFWERADLPGTLEALCAVGQDAS